MSKPLRVLLADGSSDDAAALTRVLKRGGFDPHIERVDNAKDMSRALDQKTWDVVISEHRMLEFSAVGALALLHKKDLKLPFIIVSGTIGEEMAVQLMKAGAHDYVMKEKLDRLVPAIERELGEVQVRQEREFLKEQLIQSQKMEAIGKLAGGIAHDFNNILTTSLGFSDFLLSDLPKDTPAYRDAEEIKKASIRGCALTRHLLAISRKQVLEPTVADLNNVIAGMEKMLQRIIGEDINLTTVMDPNLYAVRVDLGQMEQAILNLALNARDATPKGGQLMIETKNVNLALNPSFQTDQFQPGQHAMVSVTDTGGGIDKDVLAHVFEPFSTKPIDQGADLGLAAVYGIVTQSGGNIEVINEPGIGTKFKLYFPRINDIPVPAASDRDMNKPRQRPESILLVEDDEAVRILLRRALGGHDYRIREACDGEDALRVYQQHKEPIDLMITDIVMPRMGGDELANRLTHLCPDMKVLFISGYSNTVAIQNVLQRPHMNFLRKPFSPEVVARKVRDVLDEVTR